MRSRIKFLHYVLLMFLLLTSCKAAKIASGTTNTTDLSAKKVIANHYNNTFRFNTLKARIKAGYDDGSKTANLTASLRMEKDQNIWLSVKLGGLIVVAKALITPKKVQYYEIVNNTYFDGDFALLSKWLGTDLDFEKVQNLLLGQALYNLKQEKYTSTIETPNYVLAPKKELELFNRLFMIRSDNFKLQNQKLTQNAKNSVLQIAYPEYQRVGNQDFPKNIQVKASQPKKESTIVMEYKDVQYNSKVSFPFNIPSGAKQITIK